MSTVYNPEADVMAQIEVMELGARDLRRKIERAHNESDRRVLNKLLGDLRAQIEFLLARLD